MGRSFLIARTPWGIVAAVFNRWICPQARLFRVTTCLRGGCVTRAKLRQLSVPVNGLWSNGPIVCCPSFFAIG